MTEARLDFEALRRRIGELHAALDARLEGSAASREALRRERTARYALPARARRATGGMPVVPVRVGVERLGLPAAVVEAVVAPGRLVACPRGASHVPFLVAFRGEPLLVVALHALQGSPTPAVDPAQRLAIVRWGAGRTALLVDEAFALERVDPATLARPPAGWLTAADTHGVTAEGMTVLDLGGLAARLSSRREGPA